MISATLSKKYSHYRNMLLCNDPSEYEDRLLLYHRYRSKKFKFPLNRYTLDGIYINQFWSYSDAIKQFSTSCISVIKNCAEGKYCQAKGFVWKFAKSLEDKEDIIVNIPQDIKNKYSKIVQVDEHNKILNIFNTILDASKQCNIPTYFVKDLLVGKKQRINNYTFKYFYATKPLNIGETLT